PAMQTAEPPPELTEVEVALAWLNEHSGLVVAVVSGLLGLAMLRSIVRSAARTAAEQKTYEIDGPAPSPPAPAFVRSARHRSAAGGRVHDELREIVRENPSAAASVLQSWIGSRN